MGRHTALGGLAVAAGLGLAGAVGAVLWGCHGEGPRSAPCATVAARFLTIAEDQLAAATVDEPARRRTAAQLPPLRDALAAACEAGGWPAAVRDCLANATERAALAACTRQLTPAQAGGLERAVPGSAAPPGSL
jgi:hypothetical protein